MKSTPPPRLHVLLAREAPTAVVIRRGPTRHTAVIGWDRRTDTFTVGQWLHGRIYERRSDLSPDGRHLIYFAMNGRWKSSAKGSWTAISRAPYLKAVSLFAKGDCWHGGGLFQSSREYWLNDGYGHDIQQEDRRLARVTTYPWHEAYGGECPGVYFIRLQRDGWAMKSTSQSAQHGQVTVFEKKVGRHWLLRKLAHASSYHAAGRGVYFDTHELVNTRTDARLAMQDWDWADLDGPRLVWTAGGRLHAGRIGAQGLDEQQVLHDFGPLQHAPLAAPY